MKNSSIPSPFPIYGLSISDNFLVFGGGGGATKSGISNGIYLYQLIDGKFVLMNHLSTSLDAPTCLSFKPNLINLDKNNKNTFMIAAGVNDHLFALQIINDKLVINRKCKSDHSPIDSYQKFVCFSLHNKVYTCGNDNTIRSFKFPKLTLLWERKCNDQVMDIASSSPISSSSENIAFCTKDILVLLECSSKKESIFKTKNSSLKFRSLKFTSKHLVMAECSLNYSILTFKPMDSKSKMKEIIIKDEIITILSSKGDYIAYGTKKGSIGLLDSNGNFIIKERERHKMLVTTLDIGFNGHDVYVVSGSVCGDVMVTTLRDQKKYYFLLYTILFLILSIIFAYWKSH